MKRLKNTFKKLALCVCAALAVIMCIAAAGGMGTESAVPVQSVSTAGSSGYCLRDWQGYVAVFEDGDEAPSAMTDIQTGTLNLVDREKLRSGIKAATREELLSLLEDFSS